MLTLGRWEMFREQSEELVSDVSFYVLAVWRIKPHNVSFPFSLTGPWDVMLKPSRIFAFAHRPFVFGNRFGEFLLIARKLK